MKIRTRDGWIIIKDDTPKPLVNWFCFLVSHHEYKNEDFQEAKDKKTTLADCIIEVIK